MNNQQSAVTLGKSDIQVSPVGIGAWAWGDSGYWGSYKADDLRAAFHATLAGGINWIDTAEIYGMGRSERFVGSFLREAGGQKVVIATKFFPIPWRLFRGQLLAALRASLRRLGLDRVDLYQIHWPTGAQFLDDQWVSVLGDAVEAGLTRLAGVSNFSTAQTRRAYDLLAARGNPLASNQVHYSLLRRGPEFTGLLDLCRERGISLIAYSPLEQGILTGKYTLNNPPPGVRRFRYSPDLMTRVQPLIGLLREIGGAHGGKTPGQVAINWCICKGSLPIPGARNARQAQEIAGSLGWNLTADEVQALDTASARIKT